MTRRQTLKALGRDTGGATIIEFAMMLPVACILLVGTFDLGYRSYVTSIVQGALHEASRMATVGGVPMEDIEAHVEGRLQEFSRGATIETSTQSYADFMGVNMPEPITQDTAPLGTYNDGDCFRDMNGSGEWEPDRGTGGMGGSEDVVRFEVRMTYPRLFPMGGLLGWSDEVEVVQNTVLRNQPFAGRNTATAPVVC